jgi:hypothetical protein
LRSYDLMSIVDGSDVLPQFIVNAEGNATAVNPTYQLRQKKDQFILAWFNATLNSSQDLKLSTESYFTFIYILNF